MGEPTKKRDKEGRHHQLLYCGDARSSCKGENMHSKTHVSWASPGFRWTLLMTRPSWEAGELNRTNSFGFRADVARRSRNGFDDGKKSLLETNKSLSALGQPVVSVERLA